MRQERSDLIQQSTLSADGHVSWPAQLAERPPEVDPAVHDKETRVRLTLDLASPEIPGAQ